MKYDSEPTELSGSSHGHGVVSPFPSSLEDTSNRLLCISSEQEASGVLFPPSRSNGLAGGCVPDSLG